MPVTIDSTFRGSDRSVARRFGLALVVLSTVAGAARARGGEASFLFRGAPVPPQCLEPFSVAGAEAPPEITRVELAACAGSPEAPAAFESNAKGWLSFRRGDDERGATRGAFGYRTVGTLGDGRVVVETWDNGGGSGTYSAVFLVRREADRLELTGAIEGGDRCLGGIAEVAIDGRDLLVDFAMSARDLEGFAAELVSHGARSGAIDPDLGSGPPRDCIASARYRYAKAAPESRKLVAIAYDPRRPAPGAVAAATDCLREALGGERRVLALRAFRKAATKIASCVERRSEP